MVKHRNLTVVHYDPAFADKALCGVVWETFNPIVLTGRRSSVTCVDCLYEMSQCRVCGGFGEHDWEMHRARSGE
jgi:hypothetical protein